MYLLNDGADAIYQERDGLDVSLRYTPDKDEPEDTYLNYQVNKSMLLSGHYSLGNLFDDSNTKDEHWFNIAREYLEKRSNSPINY